MSRNLFLITIMILTAGILFIHAESRQKKSVQTKSKGKKMEIKLESPAFKNGEPIPAKYTCDGENISPALYWDKPSDKIKNFCLIVEDPDAPGGDFVHCIIIDIPGKLNSLQENVTNQKNLPDGAEMGTNDARRIGYFGPCPPSGGAPRYYFRIYGIDTILKMDAGATKNEVLKAMKGHIVAQGELMGKYQR
ncbi:MAG: YbhB/YbcL family Raf kinase inhibitor-like protein [Clostridiales bacterium]